MPRKSDKKVPTYEEVRKKAEEKANSAPPIFGRSKTTTGPKIPGSQARPVVGETSPKPKTRVRKTKGRGPAKDEVEKSERYVNGQVAAGISQHSKKLARVAELKKLIEPLTPSLIQVMSDIAHDKKVHPAIRLDAADKLITRLHGRPTERVEITDPNEDADTDEVTVLLNRVLESVGAPLITYQGDIDELPEGAMRTKPEKEQEGPHDGEV